jgi:PAS domain S-box-containing protein
MHALFVIVSTGLASWVGRRMLRPEGRPVRVGQRAARPMKGFPERRERLPTLLESITDAFFSLDVEWRLTYFNPAAERFFASIAQKDPGDLLGKNLWEEFPEAVGSRFYEEYHRALSQRAPVQVEEYYAPLGVWLEARAFPNSHGLSVFFRDVTERKQAEAQRARLLEREREARQEAEAATRIRDELLGIISHDLRNPLHTVSLSAELLLRGGLPEERRTGQLEVILRSVKRMNRLVDDLLDLSKLHAGQKLAMEPSVQELSALMREACEDFRGQVEQKSLRLECELPEEPCEVWADRDRLLQVLSNLLGNALKFTPEGGRILLRVEPLGSEARVTVADTGPGIPESDRERLFEPYWQAERTARRGAGLGLPIAKAIVEEHGGRIWVESRPGGGSTFRFTIPAVLP